MRRTAIVSNYRAESFLVISGSLNSYYAERQLKQSRQPTRLLCADRLYSCLRHDFRAARVLAPRARFLARIRARAAARRGSQRSGGGGATR